MLKTGKETKSVDFIDKYKILTEDGVDLNKKTIFVTGELTEDLGTLLRIKYAGIKLFWQDIKKEVLSDINIDISSCGGSIYSINAVLDFYDELKNEDVLVNTSSKSICMSAATLMLAGGTGKRTASKRVRFMLHDIQVDEVGGTATQVIQQAKTLQLEQNDFFRFYVECTREKKCLPISENELKKEIHKWKKRFANNSTDHYISAYEAKKLKLIDEVI